MKLSRLVFYLAFATSLFSQTNGTITGTATDTSKAVIPGVQVTAYEKVRDLHRTTTTNATGDYALPFLPPGEYEVEFKRDGFATVIERVTLGVTERIAVNAALQPSAVSEKVEVTSSGDVLQTETSSNGRVVDSLAIKQLPLSSRNFTQLLTLSPGTSGPPNDATALGRGTQNISANGARLGSNGFMIDGIDAVNIHIDAASENSDSSNGITPPSPEALQEFKVQTSLYDAQSGRAGGANVSVVTKSGSNEFHGSAFEFFRNTVLNANSFFFNTTGTKRPVLNQNQFGGTTGGPIRKNRTFFFLSYQGTRQVNGYSGSASLSLPAIPTIRTAAAIGAAFANAKPQHGTTTIAANGSNINPVALSILNLKLPDGTYVVPSPQVAGSGVNYSWSVPSRFTEDQGIASIDHQFSDANHLSVKVHNAADPTFKSLGSANVPGFGTAIDFTYGIYVLSDTHIFSPSLVNEATAGVQRSTGTNAEQNQIPLSSIGMNRFNSSYYNDIPLMTVTGAFEIGYNINGDQGTYPTLYTLRDTLSWVKGRHQIKFGAEHRRYDDNYYNRNRYRGDMTIPSFADFLVGLAGTPVAQGGNGSTSSNITTTEVASGTPVGADRITDAALFVQDDWKVNPRLTLNLGVRWEYFGMPVDVYGRRGNFDYELYTPPPAGGSTSAGFVQGTTAKNPLPGLPKVNPTFLDHCLCKNFAPRVGFAEKLTDRLVLRGGYGIFYDQISNQLGYLIMTSPPNTEQASFTGTTFPQATLQNPFPVLPLPSQFPVLPVLYSPTNPNAPSALSINDLDPNLRMPYVQQWGLSLQQQLARDTVLEVGYVGTKGVSLTARRDLNQALLASPSNPINGITTNTSANASLRVPYVGLSPTGLLNEETAADSHYHALQASVTQRFRHGLRFLASYTFSKSIDDTSGSALLEFSAPTGDNSSLGVNKGPSDFDRTNRFVANAGYQIPAFGGAWNQSAFGKKFFTGWEISGIEIVQSGTPFTVTDSTGAAYYGVTSSYASWASGATMATAELSGSTESRLSKYFNTAAFIKAGSFFGNTGRNILRGPGQSNTDLALSKAVSVTERLRLEIRGELFNALNHVNFSNPTSAITSSTFGQITSTIGNPRIVQFAMKLSF